MFIVYQAYKSIVGRLFQALMPNLPHSFNTIIGRLGDCLIFDRTINLKMKKLNISSHQRRSTRIIPPGVFSFIVYIALCQNRRYDDIVCYKHYLCHKNSWLSYLNSCLRMTPALTLVGAWTTSFWA